MLQNTPKVQYVQGIRGICCILICLLHFLLAFLPLGYIGWGSHIEEEMQYTEYFTYFPYSIFLNSSFPLLLLISLIGFTIGVRYFQTKDMEFLKQQARKRYLRLMPSVLVITLISYAIYFLSFNYNVVVGEYTQNSWLILSSYSESNSWLGAIFSGLFRVFFMRDGDYCAVLWCYHIIFMGSFLVYGFLALFGTSSKRAITYALLAIGLWYTNNTNFLCLVGGILAADLTVNHTKACAKKNPMGILLVIVGLLFGSLPSVILPTGIDGAMMSSIGVVFLLVGLEQSKWLQTVLSHKVFVTLGKYSSSIVLVHFCVLISVSCYTYYRTDTTFGIPLLSLSVAFLSYIIGTTFFVSLFYRFVECPLLTYADVLNNKDWRRTTKS